MMSLGPELPKLSDMDDGTLAFAARLTAAVMAAGLPCRPEPVAELLAELAGRLEREER